MKSICEKVINNYNCSQKYVIINNIELYKEFY